MEFLVAETGPDKINFSHTHFFNATPIVYLLKYSISTPCSVVKMLNGIR